MRRVEGRKDGPPKGPVLGPMVICGVSLRSSLWHELRNRGVRDSKKISPERREELALFLREEAERIEFVEIGPEQIDRARDNGSNMNQIEADGFARILNKLDPPRAYLDSASANAQKFASIVEGKLKNDIELVVEHSADENYPPVSAASILAKVRRDKRIDELKDEHGETGSGYPVDERTIKFLEKWMEDHDNLPNCARKSWKTAQRIKDRS